MPRPRTYKLFHSCEHEESKIYFKTTMKDDYLIKLIKIWLLRLSNIVQEYDFGTDEMMKILETFNCVQVNEKDVSTYYEANLFDIWEYANTWYSDDEVYSPEFTNAAAEKIFKCVVKRNEEWYGKVRCEDNNSTRRKLWEEFWKDICTNEDGTLNLEQIQRELADFHFMIKHVPKVYCTVTGDTLSKPTYDSKTVIKYYENHLNEVVSDRFDEVIEELEGMIAGIDDERYVEGVQDAISLIKEYK